MINPQFNTLVAIFSARNVFWPSAMAPCGRRTRAAAWCRISPDGKQQIITQQRSGHFQGVTSEATRYLEGTLPNGLAFARNGDILISNFGTDCLELMTREGATKVLADSIDGEADRKSEFCFA